MKKPVLFTLLAIILVVMFFTQVNQSLDFTEDHKQLIDLVKVHQGVVDFNTDSLRLQDVKAISVKEGGREFKVTTRLDKMTIQNCAACHQEPLTSVGQASFERKSHWEITSAHGKAKNVNCITCHNPTDLNQLNVGITQTVGFDRSYQLCSVCHSTEFQDWSGGAHGKRVGGWAGEKIIRNCTDCHNPHSPQFPTRRPSIMNPVPPIPE